MLRHALIASPTGEADRIAQERMRGMHELIELLVTWFDDVERLDPKTLARLLKMGSKVQKILQAGRGLRLVDGRALPIDNDPLRRQNRYPHRQRQLRRQDMAGVGSRKVFENDQVIVWNFELAPGAETPMHTHEHSYMWYTIEGAPLQIFDEFGRDLGTLEVPTGAVYSLKLNRGKLEVLSEIGRGMVVPAKHRARNVGRNTYREVLVEYK